MFPPRTERTGYTWWGTSRHRFTRDVRLPRIQGGTGGVAIKRKRNALFIIRQPYSEREVWRCLPPDFRSMEPDGASISYARRWSHPRILRPNWPYSEGLGISRRTASETESGARARNAGNPPPPLIVCATELQKCVYTHRNTRISAVAYHYELTPGHVSHPAPAPALLDARVALAAYPA